MGDRKIVSLNEDDFQNALREIGTYIDVSVEDLMRINRMAYKHAELRHAEQLLIRELMTPDVITVMPDTFLREAAQIMLSRRISADSMIPLRSFHLRISSSFMSSTDEKGREQ